MSGVRLLHWNASTASVTRRALLDAGFEVEYEPQFTTALMRTWRAAPPEVFVIDLSRLPSQGREIAIAIRRSPKTRCVPIVFCEGAPEKVNLIRNILPDAAYCTNAQLIRTLRNLQPVENPAEPLDMMNRYGSRTTAQKLGIKPDTSVAVIDPPRTLHALLGEVPEGVEFVEPPAAVTLCFVHSVDALRAGMSGVRHLAAQTKCWILWRKKTAAGHAGVTERLVRETGIDLGLVDYKICSVDPTWSAMLFAVRK